MKTQKIKAIIFDLGGVIVHGGYLDFINNYCAECLTPLGKQKILELEHLVNLGRITEKQFYQKIQKTLHVFLNEKQMHNIIVKKMKANKSLQKFIPTLKPAKTALFTNSIGHMAAEVLKARRYPVKKVFDKVFYSNVIHLAKPEIKAFDYVVKKLKVKPEEALMVDDRAGNIEQAKLAGLNGIVYKNLTRFKKDLNNYQLIHNNDRQ